MIRDVMADPACWAWEATPGDDFYEWGDGCAMCGAVQNDLVLDHDHRTGRERGFLCRSCNSREGHAGDFGIFKKYRARNPASILDHDRQYISAFGDTPIRATEREVFDASLRCAYALSGRFD